MPAYRNICSTKNDTDSEHVTKEYPSESREATRKYARIPRLRQAEVLKAAQSGATIQEATHHYNVPKTTLGHWIKRKEELKGHQDPKLVEFFESPEGTTFLHKHLTAIFLVFHKAGACGLPLIRKYLDLSGLSDFVGSSIGNLHKVSCSMDSLLGQFGSEERARLAALMPHRKITGCTDETFFGDQMIMVFMEAVSGFILAEQVEEKRDSTTWEKVSKKALEGLNAELIQMTGDEAGGLTSCAVNLLGIHKSPDLFHIQQEITKGLTGHLARAINRSEDTLKANKEELSTRRKKLLEKQVKVGKELTAGMANDAKKISALKMDTESLEKELEQLKIEQGIAREARQGISHNYHPFDLKTGSKRSAETLKKELNDSYDKLEGVSRMIQCTDKQKKRLAKSRGMVESLVQTLSFFWAYVMQCLAGLNLTEDERLTFEEFLLPLEYLKRVEKRSGKAEKEMAAKMRERLELSIRDGPLGSNDPRCVELRKAASDCADFFQRSSSCVEGHNGVLSLKHHASRCLNPSKLEGLVVIHNFFSKRKDKTTAAERFFQQKPKDLFDWLLDKVSWPVRPRNTKTGRRVQDDKEKFAA